MPNPFQAALASALAFSVGAVIPLLAAAFIRNYKIRLVVVAVVASLTLVVIVVVMMKIVLLVVVVTIIVALILYVNIYNNS